MRNILLLIGNMLRIILRRKGSIFVYFVLPIAGVLLSMLIYSGIGSGSVGIGFVDKDGSALSADTFEVLKSLKGYAVSEIDEEDIKIKLLDKKLDAVVVIPEGYEEGLIRQQVQNIKIISIRGQDVTAWIQNFLNLHTRNLLDLSIASNGDREAFERLVEEYKSNSLPLKEVKLEDQQTGKRMTVTSMGFLIMFIMLGAGMTSHFILSEKASRTFYRICSAPVRPGEYITANTLTGLLIVSMQNILVLLLMKYLFRINTFVPGPLMFLILTCFGITAIGISLLVTTFSSSLYMATTLNTLVLSPTCMLGGCYWPVSLMPEFMQKISYFVPQRWALEAIEKMQVYGDIRIILLNLLILLAFAAAMFLTAIWQLRRARL